MADNIAITPGSGASVAADEIGGVLYQRLKLSWGVDGSAADASYTDPLPVAAYPVADKVVWNGGVYSILTIPIDCSTGGDNTIVTAVPSLRIVVLGYDLVVAGAVTVRWKSGASTNLSGPKAFAANGGQVKPVSPSGVGLAPTATNTALVLNLSSGIQAGGELAYITVP